MKIYKSIVLTLILIPEIANADRYGINEGYSGGSGSLFGTLILIGATVFGYWFLWDSVSIYDARQNPKFKGNLKTSEQFTVSIIGYLFASLCMSIPILAVIKSTTNSGAMWSYWPWINGGFFAALWYLRRPKKID